MVSVTRKSLAGASSMAQNGIARSEMTGALLISLIGHCLVMGLAAVGLPYMKPDLPAVEPQPITVEFVEVDEQTRTTERARQEPKQDNNRKARDEPPADIPPRAIAPRVTASSPPQLAEPKPPKVDVSMPEEPVPAPPPLRKPAPPEKDLPPESKPKPEPKPEPKPAPQKPVLTRDADQEVQSREEFESVLKNLAPEQPAPAESGEEAAEKPEDSPLMARFGDKMTISEIDAVKRQLARCWNLMAGARYAENLVVEVKLFMNRDRSVQKAVVLDQLRYNTDSFFRAAAESALRAIRNPHCNPLDLPREKYDQWKEITIRFDPREMLL